MQNSKKIKAFTLVEILVVVAIIGLLATIVMISLSGVGEKGNNTRRIEDIRSVHTALVSYYYKATPYYFPLKGADDLLKNVAGISPAYIQIVPEDPDPVSTDYIYKATRADGATACTNVSPAFCKQFILCADLEPSASNEVFCCNKDGCNKKTAAGKCSTLSVCP